MEETEHTFEATFYFAIFGFCLRAMREGQMMPTLKRAMRWRYL